MTELMEECDYPKKWDLKDTIQLVIQIGKTKKQDIMTFRDQCFKSIVTGHMSLPVKVPWLSNMEDSEESFLNNGLQEVQNEVEPEVEK